MEGARTSQPQLLQARPRGASGPRRVQRGWPGVDQSAGSHRQFDVRRLPDVAPHRRQVADRVQGLPPGSSLTAASGVLFRIVRGGGATNLYCGRESYARHHLCAITAGMTRVINRETWKRRRLNDLHSTG
jgi:hypothetical protein